jgi:hypothetical protein
MAKGNLKINPEFLEVAKGLRPSDKVLPLKEPKVRKIKREV